MKTSWESILGFAIEGGEFFDFKERDYGYAF